MNNKLIAFDIRKSRKDVVVYGIGFLGRLVYRYLKERTEKRIIVCDRYKSGELFQGETIIHPSQLEGIKIDVDIIFTVLGMSLFEEADILRRLNIPFYTASGIFEELNYANMTPEEQQVATDKVFLYQKTIRKYTLYVNGNKNRELLHNDNSIWQVDCPEDLHNLSLVVTDKCTLRCKKCGALVPYLKYRDNVSYDDVIKPFERVLSILTYLENVVIVGGETFIYPYLIDVIKYCYSKEKVISMTIPTNGTIVPNGDLLQALRKYHVEVMISEYDVPQFKGKELRRILLNNGIRVLYREYKNWFDLGDFSKKNYSEEELVNTYLTCSGRTCWDLKSGKLSPCGAAVQMYDAGLIPDFPQDYINLKTEASTMGTKINDKMRKLIKLRYLQACKYCNGHKKNIKVAEQG